MSATPLPFESALNETASMPVSPLRAILTLTVPAADLGLHPPVLNAVIRWRLVLLRGIVWSLVGLIYAPLFAGLMELLIRVGGGVFANVMAAGIAGLACAVLYGSRALALISTGLGVSVGVVLLIVLPDQVSVGAVVCMAAALAGVVGLTVPFPERDSCQVPGKAVAGLMAGAVGGVGLISTELLLATPLSRVAALAFLVSVSGVLYVATVRGWVDGLCRKRQASPARALLATAIMALLAAVAAGSVWMINGPLLTLGDPLWQAASVAMYHAMPQTILGGLIGGGLAGMLLEIFRFSWVNDLR